MMFLVSVLGSPCFGQMVGEVSVAKEPDLAHMDLAHMDLAHMDLGHTSTEAAPASSVVVTKAGAADAPPRWEAKFDRWVDLKEVSFSARYRSVFDSNNAHEFNQGQQRTIADGKFKFDRQGKYGIGFHASSGKYFNWAYADFIGGGNEHAFDTEYVKADQIQRDAMDSFLTPGHVADQENAGGWSFYVRRLYLDLEPVKGVVLQYGSMDINRGAASEITTYDNDGYISGERIVLKRPKQLFFDEASVTYAYLGDLYRPNFFVRGERLAQSNYHQFLLRKEVVKRVNASLDYTWQNAANTMREAAEVKVPESRVLDSFRFEAYQRLNEISFSEVTDFVPGAKGYAVTGIKRGSRGRLAVEGGYAHIDPHQGVMTQSESSATLCMGVNGDSYGLGNRYFVRPTIKLTPYLEAAGFYTHEIGKFSVVDQIVWNKEALNAGLILDFKKAFFSEKKAK